MSLFEDGFETNDFSKWTGTSKSATAALVTESVNPHHGTYNAKASVPTTANTFAYCHQTIASNPILYARAEIKFLTLALSNSGNRLEVLVLDYGDYEYAVRAVVRNNGGTLYWALDSTQAGVLITTYGTHTPVIDSHYCVLIKRDVTNNTQQLWIDGVSEASATRAITNNSTRATTGINWKTGTDINVVAVDCVIVNVSAIECESEGEPPAAAHRRVFGHKVKLPSRVRERHFRHQYY